MIKCFKCGKDGHKSFECDEEKFKKGGSGNGKKGAAITVRFVMETTQINFEKSVTEAKSEAGIINVAGSTILLVVIIALHEEMSF